MRRCIKSKAMLCRSHMQWNNNKFNVKEDSNILNVLFLYVKIYKQTRVTGTFTALALDCSLSGAIYSYADVHAGI